MSEEQVAEAGPAFHALTRLLSGKASKGFSRRFCEQMQSAVKAVRLGLLDVLHGFPTGFPRERALASALRDSDPEVREAAADALFTLKHGESFGYDPNAGESEREAAVERFLRACRLPGSS